MQGQSIFEFNIIFLKKSHDIPPVISQLEAIHRDLLSHSLSLCSASASLPLPLCLSASASLPIDIQTRTLAASMTSQSCISAQRPDYPVPEELAEIVEKSALIPFLEGYE